VANGVANTRLKVNLILGVQMDPLNFKPKNILPDELVDQLAKYWCDSSHTRDENLGQFIQRVAEIGQFSKPPTIKRI